MSEERINLNLSMRKIVENANAVSAALMKLTEITRHAVLNHRLRHPNEELGDDQFEAFLLGLYSKDGDE